MPWRSYDAAEVQTAGECPGPRSVLEDDAFQSLLARFTNEGTDRAWRFIPRTLPRTKLRGGAILHGTSRIRRSKIQFNRTTHLFAFDDFVARRKASPHPVVGDHSSAWLRRSEKSLRSVHIFLEALRFRGSRPTELVLSQTSTSLVASVVASTGSLVAPSVVASAGSLVAPVAASTGEPSGPLSELPSPAEQAPTTRAITQGYRAVIYLHGSANVTALGLVNQSRPPIAARESRGPSPALVGSIIAGCSEDKFSESDPSPCEELRLQTEAFLAAVASRQRQNYAVYMEPLDYVLWSDRVVATA